ncbi:hexokinase-domain-containing protein [Delphinella strobiligena]|nr:hexokinase-domain-containing protein [Delphinella strobiligena]
MVGLGPRRQPSRKGSMADVPKDLLEQIKKLEKSFIIPQEKLKQITDHFVTELTKGLTKEGGSIPMNPTWCMSFPTGHETGTYLALDMGGTNLRVCEIHLPEAKGEFDIIQSKYRMPEELKTGTAEELWGYVADCLQQFIEYHHEGEKLDKLPLGFTFSYPASQDYIDHGVLQRWTKGFDIDGVEGKDVVPPFEAALAERGVPIKLTALINDTTGTLIASAYTDTEMKIGCIFGTGCNAAYMENVGSIPKLDHMKLPDDTPMAINCEWGAFDNEHKVLPLTKYDLTVDNESPRPGQQAFEKMIAGLYLGEIFRLVLLDMAEQKHMFEGQEYAKLKKPYSLDASFLSAIEEDPFENLSETENLMKDTLGLQCTMPELELIRRLAELIGTRAARLSACGVAAICKKKNYTTAHVGADGSVFNKYPHFKVRGAQALREILDWPEKKSRKENDPVEITAAEDGSGVGAALIAALTLKRVQEGNLAGIRDAKSMLAGTAAEKAHTKDV